MSVWNPRTWGKEKITVELLEARLDTKEAEVREVVEELEERTKMYESVNAVTMTPQQKKTLWDAVFRKSIQHKSQLIKAADKVKSSFIHTGIVELLVQDSLAPSPTTNNVIDLSSQNKIIDKRLKEFQEKVDIDAIAKSIIDDVITYGEYYLCVEAQQGVGITKVLDNINQETIVPVYDGIRPSKFLQLQSGANSKIILEKTPDEIVHFCLGSRKLRIRVEGMGISKIKISEYVRVGMPFFFGVFDLINILTLLTSLVPASYLQKINGTSIIGVSITEGTDPEKAFKVCRKYENLLNKAASYDPSTGEMTVNDLITAAGKFKVIPLLGEKGRLEKVDPRYDELTDISMFQELKKDIFGTVGVPYNFFYGGSSTKGETLKQFARYTKKLSMIQTAVANGMKQMAAIHLKQFDLTAGDLVESKFANTLISVEELDKIEFESTLTTVLGDMVEVINTVAEQGQGTINTEELAIFVNKRLSLLNLEKVINFPKTEAEPKKADDDDDDDDDPVDKTKPTVKEPPDEPGAKETPDSKEKPDATAGKDDAPGQT